MEIAQSLPGVMQTLAVTVQQFEISSRVCSRFKPQSGAFAAILADGSVVTWGNAQTMAVTVRQFKISSRVCSRFKPLSLPLLPFWKMDPSSPGVMQTVAVTVRQFEISSRVCSRFKPQGWGLCCDSGRWIRRYLGWCKLWRWQFGSSRSAQGCAADSSHWWCLCCDSGRWICRYLGWWRPVAVTVRQFEISSRVCSRFKPHLGICCDSEDGSVVAGVMQMAVTVRQFEISSRVCSRFKRTFGLCCDSGRWIRRLTWGDARCGGDSSAVQDQLRGVQQIQATEMAFAAILADGSVVTGVMHAMVVTVRQFEISSTSSTSKHKIKFGSLSILRFLRLQLQYGEAMDGHKNMVVPWWWTYHGSWLFPIILRWLSRNQMRAKCWLLSPSFGPGLYFLKRATLSDRNFWYGYLFQN